MKVRDLTVLECAKTEKHHVVRHLRVEGCVSCLLASVELLEHRVHQDIDYQGQKGVVGRLSHFKFRHKDREKLYLCSALWPCKRSLITRSGCAGYRPNGLYTYS